MKFPEKKDSLITKEDGSGYYKVYPTEKIDEWKEELKKRLYEIKNDMMDEGECESWVDELLEEWL